MMKKLAYILIVLLATGFYACSDDNDEGNGSINQQLNAPPTCVTPALHDFLGRGLMEIWSQAKGCANRLFLPNGHLSLLLLNRLRI